MIKIGLTGPTGAGKSSVAAYLSTAGLPLIDADWIAREITRPGQATLSRLADAFGADILLPDGALDRGKLALRAFGDPDSTRRLNAITHPAILSAIAAAFDAAAATGARAAVLDAPLLFETALDRVCDHTVAVLAPRETRLSRILTRDHLSEADALRRMGAQQPDAFYTDRAETMIVNDGSRTALEQKAAELLAQIGRWSV